MEPDLSQSSLSLRTELQANVRILLAARLAVVSFFMGLVVFYQAGHDMTGTLFPALTPVAAAYALTIIYATISRSVSDQLRFVYIQLFLDVALVGSIIYCTGGVNSPFSFLFILTIIAAAIFLWRGATYVIATSSSALYMSLLALEYLGIIHPYYIFPPAYNPAMGGYVFMTGVMKIAVFYLVAYLSGYLTELLRKTDLQLVKKSEDFTMLEAFNKSVVENMGSGLLAMDMRGVIVSHNPAAERILRLKPEEINHKKIETVLGLGSLRRFFTYLETMDGDSRQFDWTRVKKGRETNLNMTISKLTVDGKIRGAVAVFQDITNLKIMEREIANAERLAAIGRVAAGIAHEIRNPLASLSGSIEMLKSEGDFGESAVGGRLMDIIMRETDRLNRIITQFLEYASPARISVSRVDMCKMLTETIILMKANPKLGENISVKEEIQKDLFACADSEQIRQVVWNLLINAVDSMENGGVLTVKASKARRPYDRRQRPRKKSSKNDGEGWDFVKITVSDTGGGIDPEDLSKIFEPFFTTKQTGTGLGLSTVHKIVESHGGMIMADSAPGKGSSFSVWLPAHKNGDAEDDGANPES